MITRFHDQLRSQLSFLARSSIGYDAGYADEAIRIATVIRILFHNTGTSTSLLNHLDAECVLILSTCPPIPENAVSFEEMTAMRVSGTAASVEPNFDRRGYTQWLSATDWWIQPVSMPTWGRRLQRRDIVLEAANRDGGAHVDATLNEDYVALKSGGGGIGASWLDASGEEISRWAPTQVHLAYLRQFAFELLNSAALFELIGLSIPIGRRAV